MDASVDSRNCDSAQDATEQGHRTAGVFAEDWAGDEDGEITTPRLSLMFGAPAVVDFRPAARGTFERVIIGAAADLSDRDWPSAMAAAAGPERALLADARGFTGDVIDIRPRGELS